jgi:hypothetical protein
MGCCFLNVSLCFSSVFFVFSPIEIAGYEKMLFDTVTLFSGVCFAGAGTTSDN